MTTHPPPLSNLLVSTYTGSSPISIPSRQGTPPLQKDTDLSTPSSDFVQTPRTGIVFGSPASPQFQSPLLRTPCEIIHKVLCSSGVQDPTELSRAAKTCKELRSLIYDNPGQALWRDIHLDLYDDPRTVSTFKLDGRDIDWKRRVQHREFVGRIAREWGEDKYHQLPKHLDVICDTLSELYLDMPALNPPELISDDGIQIDDEPAPESYNLPLLETILRSSLFIHLYLTLSYRSTQPLLRPLTRQFTSPLRRTTRMDIHPVLSMLHCLLPPDFNIENEAHRTHRGYLREMVYGSHHYNANNDWGPYTQNGKVDWRLMDAICSVMMANAKDIIALGEESWRLALKPLSYGLESVRGWGWHDVQRPAELEDDEVWDWAGVEGVWCGSYAFLDYADWIGLNEPGLLPRARQAGHLDLSRYSEAIGDLLHMHLQIDRSSSSPSSQDSPPPPTSSIPTGDLLPPIHFSGHSAASGASWPTATASSFVRGTVQLTTDNPPQVRWTMVIRYGGEDRWKVEGVQVGGRGSKRGFFGVWTDAAKEQHSPNGPAWYWKL